MPTEPPNTRLPPRDRNAALIAAAREQFQQTPSHGDSSQSIAAFDAVRAEFQKYEVVRELHRGGQGVVYLAVQRGTRRQVAIKMVREGPFASPSERRRFQREIEILGILKHPNIVTIHDSGTVAGSSYYVMDYVDGPPLDDYVRTLRVRAGSSRSRAESKRFVRDTLTLFAKICDAVQVAHLRGVIHRDLKPSNVRVDSQNEPRVLDFGLAKTTVSPDGSSAPTNLTQTGQFVGTLAYASPEQAEGAGDDVDIRTDVYSLGVMLYELVTGHLPYVVTGTLPDVLENIRHAEPTRPSSHMDLRGDLDTILLKCLSKSKDRRYQAAGELGADLRRYINGKPIEAKRDSAIYMLRMFARRHRVAALVVIAFITLLGISSATLAYMYSQQVQLRELAEQNERRATDNEALAIKRAEETKQVAEFQASQLSGIDTELMGVRLRRDLLDNAREAVQATGVDENSVAQQSADLERVLAGVNFTNLALNALDENIFERTVQAIDDQFDEQPLVRAGLLQALANTMKDVGLLDQAVAPQTQALQIRRSELGNEHRDTLASINSMGKLLRLLGRFDEALPYSREAMDTRRLVLGDEHRDTLTSMDEMGQLHQSMGQRDEAMANYKLVLDVRRRVLGDEDSDTLVSIGNMGSLYVETGQWDDAMHYVQEALDTSRRVLGEEHRDTLTLMNNMGFLLTAKGRHDEAMTHYEEALGTRRRVLGDEHPETLNTMANLGRLVRRMGRFDEAMSYYQEALDGNRRVLGNEHLRTVQTLNGMGSLLQSMGRYDEAMAYLREALEASRRVLGDEHTETLTSINNMGALLHSMGRLDEATPYYQEALDIFRRVLGDDHPNTLTMISNVGSLLTTRRRFEDAMPYRRESVDGCRRVLGDEHPKTLKSIMSMGYLFLQMERFEEAESNYREALDGCRRVLGEEHPITHKAIGSMGGVLQSMGRLDEAMAYRREALDGRRRVLGDEHPDTLHSINKMGNLLQAMERFNEAEQLYLEAAAGLEKLPPKHRLHDQVAQNLVKLYETWHATKPAEGYDQKAAHWRMRLEDVEAETPSSPKP